MKDGQIKFKPDTADRKKYFVPGSFAHPAKMVLGLQIYLIEHYTKPGDTILDPMAGSGTILIATHYGRNVICVELEKKFINMQKQNWSRIQSIGPVLGCTMGTAMILQGDARNLPVVLADVICTSPPYADQISRREDVFGKNLLRMTPKQQKDWRKKMSQSLKQAMQDGYSQSQENIGNLPYGQIDAVVTSPPYAEALSTKAGGNMRMTDLNKKTKDLTKEERQKAKEFATYSKDENNIGNLPYGQIDAVVTSPPYAETLTKANNLTLDEYRKLLRKRGVSEKAISKIATPASLTRELGAEYGKSNDNIGNLPYKADAVITSPPYEEAHSQNIGGVTNKDRPDLIPYSWTKTDDKANIGNLKSDNYLEAMLQVYQNCHKVLKEGGLMCLVTKNFIRDKKIVRLDLDTIKLCEKAGFTLKERLKRKLTQQSFWRTIYKQRYPDAPEIKHEDVLIFQKGREADGKT